MTVSHEVFTIYFLNNLRCISRCEVLFLNIYARGMSSDMKHMGAKINSTPNYLTTPRFRFVTFRSKSVLWKREIHNFSTLTNDAARREGREIK